MKLEERLKSMNTNQLEEYKKKEKTKAIIGTVLSVIPVTAALGALIGGFAGYELLPYIDTSGTSPPEGYAMAMFTISAPAFIGGTVSWLSGAVYSGKKWYNTYKTNKKLNELLPQDKNEKVKKH